ncbi:keratin, type II cytoskeletal 8-like [Ambystoma mexicanum]|uniref:keratin, type II cytoskeletal 8-like n=1 Tax=Ambystoma mexicanum TaxID=8296 RepID=UPI0037E9A467
MSLYNGRYGDGRSFSSGSHGTLSGRSWAPSVGYQPGMQRSTSALSLARNGPVLARPTPGFLLSSLPTLEIDPKLHQIRSNEKEQIKGLNNQFVSFINKVRDLERQNKILEAQLSLLKDRNSYKSNANQIMQVSSNNLKQQIDNLLREKEKLETELANMEALLKDLKNRYEDEINRRNQLENDFVLTKKDLDDTYLQKVDTESKLDSTSDEINYLRQLFDEEIRELESQVHNAEITVELDNTRELEMKQVMEEVKQQYQAMAEKGQQEAEHWYKSKLDDIANQAQRHNEDLKNVKNEISELTRQIQRGNGEIDALKNQRTNLENAIGMAEDKGEQAMRNTKDNIQELEEALKRAKQDMAGKVREYQDLMNTKLALDIEIATYRKLLEGEETRLIGPAVQTQMYSAVDRLAGSLMQDLPISSMASTNVSSGFSAPANTNVSFNYSAPVSANPAPTKKPVMIKTIETVNGQRISESSQYSKD